MAKSVIIPIKSVFDDKGLKQAQSQFGSLGKSFKNVLGGAGLAIGLSQITQYLQQSAKAAAEDAKSQALLANGLRNSVGATDLQIKAVEESIRQMQIQAAVADDQIRPAFDQLARSTGNLEDATRLTNIALDISAATGRDLGSVSIALGKAVNGSTTALSRLGINVKGVADPIGLLEQRFDGAAEAAANTDPFQRIQIIMEELSEQVGTYLLPAMQELATYMASAEFESGVNSFFTGIDTISAAIDTLTTKVPVLTGLFNELGKAFDNGYWVNLIPIIGPYITTLAGIGKQSNAGSGVNTTTLAGILAASGGMKTPIPKTPTPTPRSNLGAGAKAAEDAAKRYAEAYKKILETEAQIREEAVQAAQETTDAIMAMRDSFTDLLKGVAPLKRAADDIGDFEQQVVDSFGAIEEAIGSAVADGTLLSDAADQLRAYASSEKDILAGIARQRDALTKKIDIAKAISSGVVSVANLTGLLDTQTRTVTESFTQMVNGIQVVVSRSFEQITQGGLVDNFKKVIDKTKQYAKNLIELKRLGLNGQLFKQLVDAGVDGGADAAQAIADGGQATVTELNSLFGELNNLGSQIAETSTDIMYAAGEDTMNSFIEGLLAQDAALEQTAMTLADKFASVFRSRLVGLTPLPAMPMNTSDISLSDAMQGYVADQLGRTFTGPYNYYSGQMVGGMGSNYNININAGVVTNKAELGDVLASTLKQYVRVNGPIGIS